METKVKENGQIVQNAIKADKSPKFVAGNPVNAVSVKTEENKENLNGSARVANAAKTEATKRKLNRSYLSSSLP
ncbi:hypothetical protein OQZ33_17095 [Pedobacter sp. MC2016-05]|uniref:hypothetical protein n=1 Tax=Pedobacter sp. MC2016-05 TaxID=2994474 RepID=UPI0022481C6A|nr:hypothetical protein [Pedobacter sp. MC2016-05]MCX2476053.1 hypothetical protein [Pedobacter sp. MC2016-05]